jgi:hypothetical protein
MKFAQHSSTFNPDAACPFAVRRKRKSGGGEKSTPA